jgi:hypothetical protein
LFIGRFDGKIKFYRNTGSQSAPQFVADVSPVDTISAGQNCVPAFIDYDGDGDMDLFVGKANGQINFYRNTGDAAHFQPLLADSKFLDSDVGADASPTFTDIDHDGDADLFIGNDNGNVYFYENTGTATSPQFVLRTDRYASTDPMRESAPAFADIDGDGDPDLFVGTSKGGLHFYRNNSTLGVEEAPAVPNGFELDQNFPNPFNPGTYITFQLDRATDVTVVIFDILGRRVKEFHPGTLPAGTYDNSPGHNQGIFWDGRNDAGTPVSSGVYITSMVTPSVRSTKKILLIR